MNCSGYGIPPATNFANFALNLFADMDFYYVSLVTGYNVAVAVVPQGGNGSKCAVTGCIYDIDGACPQELKLGGTCRRPCYPIENSSYCCTSNALNTVMCPPPVYSTLFKKACPRAYYRYALDGDTRTFRACAMMGGIFGSSVKAYYCHINSLSNFLLAAPQAFQYKGTGENFARCLYFLARGPSGVYALSCGSSHALTVTFCPSSPTLIR